MFLRCYMKISIFCTNSISKKHCAFSVKAMSTNILNEKGSVVAVCQMTSVACKNDNFSTCEQLVKLAKSRGALMTFLPEACDYICTTPKDAIDLAEPLDGPFVQKCKQLARDNSMWISLGGIHEVYTEDKIYNCHVIINSDGNIVGTYRKIHTFDANLSHQLSESSYVEKGNSITPPVKTIVGKVGMAICYDLRFPEVGISLTEMGAEILTYPSAFTYETGSYHWEVLLRSRAIENQCYVIAAAQTGFHNQKRQSWGHAMIVDPYGTICAQCSEGSTIATAEINTCLINQVANKIPVWRHRRYDLYPKLTTKENILQDKQDCYQFGPVIISLDMVFYKSSFSVAFVNKRCVVPGHVLVIPIRPVRKLCELNSTEVADMFITVQKVQTLMERVHNTSSTTIAIQDGPDAGQTIWHLHAHILPRKPGDFADNDDIYRMLEKHDKKPDGEWRSEEEMKSEANFLRNQFN